MSISVVCFTCLFILSLTLYLYSNFKLIRQLTHSESFKPEGVSAVEHAKRQRATWRLLWIRTLSPFLGLIGVIWGIIWLIGQYGLFSAQVGLFFLGLFSSLFVLKCLLSQALRQLLQNLSREKR